MRVVAIESGISKDTGIAHHVQVEHENEIFLNISSSARVRLGRLHAGGQHVRQHDTGRSGGAVVLHSERVRENLLNPGRGAADRLGQAQVCQGIAHHVDIPIVVKGHTAAVGAEHGVRVIALAARSRCRRRDLAHVVEIQLAIPRVGDAGTIGADGRIILIPSAGGNGDNLATAGTFPEADIIASSTVGQVGNAGAIGTDRRFVVDTAGRIGDLGIGYLTAGPNLGYKDL